MADRAPSKTPWTIVAACALLLLLLLYTLFAAYLPAKHRAARLEAELKALYAREAELQTKLAQLEQRQSPRLRALTAERDTLVRRLEELQKELDARRKQ